MHLKEDFGYCMSVILWHLYLNRQADYLLQEPKESWIFNLKNYTKELLFFTGSKNMVEKAMGFLK